jgi:DNA-binding response OmpR family regulator
VGLLGLDLILIQRPLPGALDAFETCRALRSCTEAVLVIVLAEPGSHDELIALAVGADHLLPADTPLDIAIARLRSLVRRAQGRVVLPAAVGATAAGSQRLPDRPVPGLGRSTTHHVAPMAGGSSSEDLLSVIVDGDLEIDVLAHEVRVAERPVDVTRIEFDLLVVLARNPRRVVTRDQLMDAAWDTAFDNRHVLDAHLSRLRCKIAQAGGQRVAHAVRGVGYRLRD